MRFSMLFAPIFTAVPHPTTASIDFSRGIDRGIRSAMTSWRAIARPRLSGLTMHECADAFCFDREQRRHLHHFKTTPRIAWLQVRVR